MKRLHRTALALSLCASLLAAPSAFAAEIQSLNGRSETVTVTIPDSPARIAVIDAAVLDMLDHWGLGDRIVALPKTTKIPAFERYYADKAILDVGTLKEVSLERLMESEPDVIFISGRLAKKYDELSRIAPVVYLTPDRKGGAFASFAKNLRQVAKVFGKDVEEKAEADIRGFEERLAAIREKSKGRTALVGLVTSSHVNRLGNAARCSLIGNEFGFTNVAEKANANHGNEASFELLVKHDPDYFFVLDRDSAIARPGAKLAQDILNNEMVDRMQAKKNDRIVYLTPAAWYLAEGGVKAMDSMFSDVEKALGLR